MKYGYLTDVSNVDFILPKPPPFQDKYISSPTSNELNFYVGSSVWSDKDFKGHFYPEKTAQKNFLSEYAKQFKTVEVNSTRYGTPKASTLETWKNSVPDDFRFAFKMPQIISVRKNILSNDVLSRLEDFVIAMDKMGKKAGTTFILLQNNFNEERLEELNKFLHYLPHEQSFAVEIRNAEFNQSQELIQVLNKHKIASVITDTAGERSVTHTAVSSNTAFIRFVGNGLLKSDYERIDLWVNQIQQWVNLGVRNFYCLHHQPNKNGSFSGYSAKYMIEALNNQFPKYKVRPPSVYKNPSLF